MANLDELSKAIAKIDADVIVLTEIDNKTARSKKSESTRGNSQS